MKTNDDSWQKRACANGELLEREISSLEGLLVPIREKHPIITKYQDFWNQAKQISNAFRNLKPLSPEDRDRLWKKFSAFCEEAKAGQQSEYHELESLSKGHCDEIMTLLKAAPAGSGAQCADLETILAHGHSLQLAAELLGRYKHEMIARHKKQCFGSIQQHRKALDEIWNSLIPEKNRQYPGKVLAQRKNLEKNYERYRKAAEARDHFQGIVDDLKQRIATAWTEEWRADAIRRVVQTERRIGEIDEDIRKLEEWIEKDSLALCEK